MRGRGPRFCSVKSPNPNLIFRCRFRMRTAGAAAVLVDELDAGRSQARYGMLEAAD